jgi:hypothetical protein
MKPTILSFVPLYRATCYNVTSVDADAINPPCCLVEIDARGLIYRSSALSNLALDGTSEFDQWFRAYCAEHHVEIEIDRDGGRRYDAVQMRLAARKAA